MYLKSDRDLYRRRRRRVPWLRLLMLLALAGGSAYLIYTILSQAEAPVTVSETPTPMPTATLSPLLYVAEAEEAYWDGDMSAAIGAYQRALDIEPNQGQVYVDLSRLLTFQGRPERGLEMAREALRRQPEYARAWAVLGLAYDWLGMPAEAIEACERAIAYDATLPEAYAYLAEAYIDAGNWIAANSTIATALELDPNSVDVHRNQGYVLENQGNYYGAIEAYREALALHDDLVHLHLAVGRNASALGNWTLALEAYEDAVDADPTSVAALDRLGWTLMIAFGDYDKAKRYLTQALDLAPDAPDVLGHLATLYFQQRNYEDAIATFRPAIRYGEARSRRRAVYFIITAEETNAVGASPQGPEVARAAFVHPVGAEMPLRGVFEPAEEALGLELQGPSVVQGYVRFDVLSGRYNLELTGVPPVPSGRVYVGWLLPLETPEGARVRTDPMFPTPEGQVSFTGETGRVAGPPIEYYYTLGLAHYLLDECNQALPYIRIALRIDPEDTTALRALELCQQ
jgi:tetratricopeptide (TPR) repeat protein